MLLPKFKYLVKKIIDSKLNLWIGNTLGEIAGEKAGIFKVHFESNTVTKYASHVTITHCHLYSSVIFSLSRSFLTQHGIPAFTVPQPDGAMHALLHRASQLVVSIFSPLLILLKTELLNVWFSL